MIKRYTVAILMLFSSSCNSRIQSGTSVITDISTYGGITYRQTLCIYTTNNHGRNVVSADFVDSCNKHNIRDTVYITTVKTQSTPVETTHSHMAD